MTSRRRPTSSAVATSTDAGPHDSGARAYVGPAHQLCEARQAAQVDVDARLADEVAARPTTTTLDVAARRERTERLPQRHTADAEGLGELLLGRQLVVRTELAGAHPAEQPRRDAGV